MTSSVPRVVMVTGASRGIGRETAIALARRGHHLVLTARSIDGVARFDGTTVGDPLTGVELSGTLAEVIDECRREQVRSGSSSRVIGVALNLADSGSVEAAAARALAEFGVVDTLVSNAIYQGPGVNDRFVNLPLDLLRTVIEGDAVAPLILLKTFLPGMLESGRGVFVHLTSGAATLSPRAPSGEGGWGVAYAMAKGAAHRIAGVLHAEHSHDGLRAYSLNPGHVTTEVMRLRAEREGRAPTGDGPHDVARVIDWLIRGAPEAVALSGSEVIARDVVSRLRPGNG
ncbi:MAG: SDR family NAD(P)-dependent oxidoreductase [Ilumatobacteraceae bacterium]